MEEIMELFELQYSDLILLSDDQVPASLVECQRLELVSERIMHELGPNGPGLLSINGVPAAGMRCQALLPLARKLALLGDDDRKRILMEHNLGSDVSMKNLDRIVSSFAIQMKYDEESEIKLCNGMTAEDGDIEFRNLGCSFKELGSCMMGLGLHLSRICDRKIAGSELERSLLRCGTAKGRLIHYHSVADNLIIQEKGRRKGCVMSGKSKLRSVVKSYENCELGLWQKWHYDFGIFTILTAPMFMLSNGSDSRECDSPMGHTYLQALQPEKNRILSVKASKGCFIVQVGESADVLSKGKLCARLHCVSRPAKMDTLSRETFVLFLQPAWNMTFSLSDYPIEYMIKRDQTLKSNGEGLAVAQKESGELIKRIGEIVPPLSSRLRDGMTFADFSKETTKQYYGGNGLQSSR